MRDEVVAQESCKFEFGGHYDLRLTAWLVVALPLNCLEADGVAGEFEPDRRK